MIVFGIVVMYYIVSASYEPASDLVPFEFMLNRLTPMLL